MTTKKIDNLVNQGRALLVSDEHAARIHSNFNTWFEDISNWLQENYPNSELLAEWSSIGVSKLVTQNGYRSDSASMFQFQEMVQKRLKWLSNLMIAINNTHKKQDKISGEMIVSKKIFIVHGRNNEVKVIVSRFLEKLGLEPIILHEQPNAGKTIIEKFLGYADVSFAIILVTPDDRGGPIDETFENQKPRARQNVILEFGFFLGAIGREKMCILYDQTVETPSDYDGVLYIPLDSNEAWKLKLAKEMKTASVPFDMNSLI